jgi:maltose-binding protein MalE
MKKGNIVNIIKVIAVALLALALAVFVMLFTGCETEASSVDRNLNTQAQYFECERRITVYNARTDKVILEVEGYMNVSNNIYDELVITCKVGENKYKKNYVYLNEYTLYVVEDITGTHTDPYHYKMYFHAPILPDIEVKP